MDLYQMEHGTDVRKALHTEQVLHEGCTVTITVPSGGVARFQGQEVRMERFVFVEKGFRNEYYWLKEKPPTSIGYRFSILLDGDGLFEAERIIREDADRAAKGRPNLLDWKCGAYDYHLDLTFKNGQSVRFRVPELKFEKRREDGWDSFDPIDRDSEEPLWKIHMKRYAYFLWFEAADFEEELSAHEAVLNALRWEMLGAYL